MQAFNIPKKRFDPQSHAQFLKPLQKISPNTPPLKSGGYRPLKMTFENQLHALIFFHLRDLTAGQVATVYKLRWDIETFFKWWKKPLKVYHLIAHSRYGLMVQILAGLIRNKDTSA